MVLLFLCVTFMQIIKSNFQICIKLLKFSIALAKFKLNSDLCPINFSLMQTFKKGDKIGKYVIHSFIKKGIVAESYTVLGPDDTMYFMKMYEFQSIPHEQLFEGKEVYEIHHL